MMSNTLKFVTPGDHRPLVYEGETDADGRWTDGVLRTEDGDVSFPVEDGIPRFPGQVASGWDDEKVRNEELRKGGVEDPDRLIESNYKADRSRFEDTVRRILQADAPRVELAVGPGGGVTPLLLDLDPNAHVVMNDLGLWPLREWQKLARRKGCWPNLRFAQFDATHMPIASDSLLTVVSQNGITNVVPSRHAALQEVFRVLRPGGTFFGWEGDIDVQTTPESPPDAMETFRKTFLDSLGFHFESALHEIGFRVIEMHPTGRSRAIAGDSDLGDFAQQYKMDAHLVGYRIEAVKP
jgi:SAM-dependent methyltransferase